jgi:hypothetical protein
MKDPGSYEYRMWAREETRYEKDTLIEGPLDLLVVVRKMYDVDQQGH